MFTAKRAPAILLAGTAVAATAWGAQATFARSFTASAKSRFYDNSKSSYPPSPNPPKDYPQNHWHIPQPVSPGTALGHKDPKDNESKKALPLLFQPFTVKDMTMPNRIIVAPMCQYSAKDGFMSDYHVAHLGSFALHGAGLILVEATGVEPRGRISPACTGIWSDDHIPAMKRVVDLVHAQGGRIGIQLNHAGRKASTFPYYTKPEESEFWHDDVVAPTGGLIWAENQGFQVPRELSVKEIKDLVGKFGEAARRAAEAGMDTVEVHAAHGYLIHQFLSPLSNQRTDDYGGSVEKRSKFMVEVIQAVRANFPKEKPIFLRVSASDLVEHLPKDEVKESLDIEQTIQIAKIAKDAGVDVIHVSSGGNTPKQHAVYAPGYQVHFAEAIKKAVPGLHVVAVGVITGGKQAEEILVGQKADFVAAARPFLRDPTFPQKAAIELGVKTKMNQQYEVSRLP